VASGATVGQSRAQRQIGVDISDNTITFERPLPLRPYELALEELSPTTNCSEWVAIDYEQRRIGGRNAASACAYLLGQ
jgi:hypothetical protein